MQRWWYIFICSWLGTSIVAQQPFTFYQTVERDTSELDGLRLRLGLNHFIKNNEYFNAIVEGYTLIGYQFTPLLVWPLSSKTKVEGGVYFLRYHGQSRWEEIRPVLSITHQFSKEMKLQLGTLEGALQHGLLPMIYHPERLIRNSIEEGIQWKKTGTGINWDAWLNWEQFSSFDAPKPEVISAGVIVKYQTSQQRPWSIGGNLQWVAKHRGGQLDSLNQPNISRFNTGAQIQIDRKFSGLVLQKISFESAYVGARDDSHKKQLPFQQGWGIAQKLRFELPGIKIEGGYWSGHGYFAPMGEPIYQSVTDRRDTTFQEGDRFLITSSASYEHTLTKGVHLGIQWEGFYHPKEQSLDFSYALYLSLRRSIRILKIKEI